MFCSVSVWSKPCLSHSDTKCHGPKYYKHWRGQPGSDREDCLCGTWLFFKCVWYVYLCICEHKSLSAAVFDSQSNQTKPCFSHALRPVKLPISVNSAGSLFRSYGPAMSNNLSPNWVLLRGITCWCSGWQKLMTNCTHELTWVWQIRWHKTGHCLEISVPPNANLIVTGLAWLVVAIGRVAVFCYNCSCWKRLSVTELQ